VSKLQKIFHAGGRRMSFAPAYLLLVFLGAILAGAFYWGIVTVQRIPPIAPTFDEKVSQAQLEALKVALTTTAGLGAAAGLYVSYRRQRNEERNSFREQDRIFTERFIAAATLLAHESAAVRLAGINSLVRLADDSTRDRDTCLSTLCSYLRIPVVLRDAGECNPDGESCVGNKLDWLDPNEWDVRRSALRHISDRLQVRGPIETWTGPVDLRGATLIETDFSECTFAERADFSETRFVGTASFRQCRFEARAIFVGAKFIDNVSFEEASSRDLFDLSNCKFMNSTTFEDFSFVVRPVFDHSTFSRELCLSLKCRDSVSVVPGVSLFTTESVSI
jgi:hypothetical protein